jgi:AcrR family transcriptional regulator
VSRGLPTHHFGSKDALVARLAERTQSRIRQAMDDEASRRRTEGSGALTALEEIVIVVDTYLEMFDVPGPDQRALLVMWGSTFPSQGSVVGMTDAERRSYEGLTDLIRSGHHDGSVRSDLDVLAAAVLLHGLMRGTAALFLAQPHPADMDVVRRTCRTWIVSALSPRSDP